MIRLDVQIPTCNRPERHRSLDRLLTLLNATSRVRLTVRADDPEHPRGQQNVVACWHAPMGDATHRLVLEDDAVPATGALAACVNFLERYPDSPVGFFCQRSFTRAALAADCVAARWVAFSGGVAQCLPVGLVRAFQDYDHVRRRSAQWPETIGVDSRVNLFVREHNLSVLLSAPSLFNHDHEIESAFGRRPTRPALAAVVFDPRYDAARHDWTGPVFDCRVEDGRPLPSRTEHWMPLDDAASLG